MGGRGVRLPIKFTDTRIGSQLSARCSALTYHGITYHVIGSALGAISVVIGWRSGITAQPLHGWHCCWLARPPIYIYPWFDDCLCLHGTRPVVSDREAKSSRGRIMTDCLFLAFCALWWILFMNYGTGNTRQHL